MRKEQKVYNVTLDVSLTTKLVVNAIEFVNLLPRDNIPDN